MDGLNFLATGGLDGSKILTSALGLGGESGRAVSRRSVGGRWLGWFENIDEHRGGKGWGGFWLRSVSQRGWLG